MKTFRYVILGILVILMVTGVKDSIERRSERERIAPRETVALSGRDVASGWKGFDLKRYRSMRPTRVTLEVEPQPGPDNYQIDLTLAPEVVDFEGFVNYGSPITAAGTDAAGDRL